MQGSAHKLKSPTEKPHLSFGAQCIHTLKLPFFKKKLFNRMLCGKQPFGALGVGNLKRYHILDGRADVGMSDPGNIFPTSVLEAPSNSEVPDSPLRGWSRSSITAPTSNSAVALLPAQGQQWTSQWQCPDAQPSLEMQQKQSHLPQPRLSRA